uniref:Transposon-encoded protein n=1 Tax=Methanococcus maripaludis (strain C6 / ATCC BAA-1332) TaxID=444158 RepID=A9A6E7_METM6
MNIPDEDILVHYQGKVKSQGSSGRIYPNPLADHVGHDVRIIIMKKKSDSNPARLTIQLQEQIENAKMG